MAHLTSSLITNYGPKEKTSYQHVKPLDLNWKTKRKRVGKRSEIELFVENKSDGIYFSRNEIMLRIEEIMKAKNV
jgi:hypothetical protein